MLYVSIFVEWVRGRPVLAVWFAAFAQALLWFLVPSLFYWGPPGDLPFVLAIGHEFLLGTYLGPPLAFWLAELAFRLAGSSLAGIYLLSQACVVVTYWAVFTLGRAVVGTQHAALAVLLMVGLSPFTVPTPDFGPVMLTMPLWAVILLHYWRAVSEGRRRYWVALAVEAGLLLLTTYAGLLLIGLLVLFTLANNRARAAASSRDPWLAVVVAVIVMLPHLIWLVKSGDAFLPALARLRTPESAGANFGAWLRLVGLVLAAHAGMFILIMVAAGWPFARRERAPVLVRRPVEPFARQFVYYFALVPALVATIVGVLAGLGGPAGGIAPLVILSGLTAVIVAGDAIHIHRQRTTISAWFGLLLIPPAMTVVIVALMPWVAIDLNVTQPAYAMGQFFADNFQRRIGSPLAIVAGEPRTAAVVALGAPSRPSLFRDDRPALSPWVSLRDVVTKGAIVVWQTNDTAGTPPPAIKEHFPDLVPEVPRAFERAMQGRLPLLRIGWGLIRPQSEDVRTKGEPK